MPQTRSARGPGQAVRDFRRNLRVLEREIEISLAAQTGCCGVTVAQCHLLLEVELRGQSSVTELAAALELDKSTLSRTVDGLCGSGLLLRQPDPASRRQQVITLSERGRTKAAAINGMCDAFYGRLLDSIPRERKNAVLESAALIGEALRKARREGGDPCRT